MNILDIVFSVFALIIVIEGVKKGFVSSVLEFAFAFLSSAVAWVVAAKTCNTVYNNYFREMLLSKLNERLIPSVSSNTAEGVSNVLSAVPDSVMNLAEKLGIGDLKLPNTDSLIPLTADNLEKNFFGPIAVFAVKCLIFVVLAVLLGIVFRIISNLISRAIKGSVFAGLNYLLGGIFGFCKATVIVLIISLIFVGISYALPQFSFSALISQSKICGFAVEILNII